MGAVPPFWGGELGPHLTQYGLDRGLRPYQVASRSIQPFGHNRRAENWGLCSIFGEGERGPYLTQCGLGRGLPSYIKWHLDPSSHLATTDKGRNLRAAVPFWERGTGFPSNPLWPGPRPTRMSSFIDLSNRLATMHQRERETDNGPMA